MPTPTEQLLSRTVYATDGATTVWDFSFSGGYLATTHVKAYTETPLGLRTEITVTAPMLIGPYQLRITPALAAGSNLTIYRDTPKNLPLVDFTDESGFSEASLDTNAKQAVFIAAEAIDVVNTTDLNAAAVAAAASAASAAAASVSQGTASAAAAAAAASSLSASGFASAASASQLAAAASAVEAAAAALSSVQLTGDQTIAGVKTFSSAIVGATSTQVSLTGAQTVVGAKTFSDQIVGSTSTQVSLTGDQTIAGIKTFSSAINEARGTIAMHATTMNIWAQPNIIDGTGVAVTITTVANAPQPGASRTVYPVAGTIIQNNANQAVDGNADYTVQAGDGVKWEAVTVSTYKVHIVKKDGTAVVAVVAVGVPAGAIAHFAMSTAPTGWLKANGALVSRATYAALFAAIGTTYGAGDGSTTFAVPDLRGEFVRGLDDGRGIDSGRGIGTAQSHQMQSHQHTQAVGTGAFLAGSSYQVEADTFYGNASTGAAGGTTNGSETRPRNVAMLACIKY